MQPIDPKKDLHPLVEVIRKKVVALIDKNRKENKWTLEQIAEKCCTSKGEICTLISGKRGRNLSLNMALKVWEGLGKIRDTLVPALEGQPLGEKVNRLEPPELSLLIKFLDVLLYKTLADKDDYSLLVHNLENIHKKVSAKWDVETQKATILLPQAENKGRKDILN